LTVKLVAAVAPNFTADAFVNRLPVIVTVTPPAGALLVGDMLVIEGPLKV
jgi:hypothetical protein